MQYMNLIVYLAGFSLLLLGGIISFFVIRTRRAKSKKRALFVAGFRQDQDPKKINDFKGVFADLHGELWFKPVGDAKLWCLTSGSAGPFLFLDPNQGHAKLPTEETVISRSPNSTSKDPALTQKPSTHIHNLPVPPQTSTQFQAFGAKPAWSETLHDDVWKELSKLPDTALFFSQKGVRFHFCGANLKSVISLLDGRVVDNAERLVRALLRK